MIIILDFYIYRLIFISMFFFILLGDSLTSKKLCNDSH